MTAKELIEELQKYDENFEVLQEYDGKLVGISKIEHGDYCVEIH